MEEQKASRQEKAAEDSEALTQRPGANRISGARKIRLAVLLLILVGAAAGTFVAKRIERKNIEQVQLGLAAELDELRKLASGLDPSEAQTRLTLRLADAELYYARAKALDPDNQEADRLAVALYYAGGRLASALQRFNDLDLGAIVDELNEADRLKARKAITPFQVLAVDAAGMQIRGDGTLYLNQCGILWQTASRITEREAPDRVKALRLCRWFALHVLPVEPEALPAIPFLIVCRGYGSAAQVAWTYAELARHVDVRTKVAILPPAGSEDRRQYLVQVYPSDGDPFLVDPFLGIPVMDPVSGELLSLESLAARPELYGSLLALAGEESPYGGQDFGEAQQQSAVHPYAVFLRFLLFDHLLSSVPAPPRVAFDFGSLAADEPLELWDVPVRILQQVRTPEYLEQSEGQYRALEMVRQPRLVQIQGLYSLADTMYTGISNSLQDRLPETDVEDAAATMREAIENIAFFSAVSAYDSGDLPGAESRLRGYLEDYPTGPWEVLAQVLLADLLSETGESAQAEELWKHLPRRRRLYGALRLKGLLPMVTVGPQRSPAFIPNSAGAESPAGPGPQTESP